MEKQKSNTSFNGQRKTENGQRTAAECNCPLPAIARRCSEVTLDEFIDCLVNDNLRRLVRSGAATDEQLRAAWEKLYDEYAKLSGNRSHIYSFLLMKTISVMRAKMVLVKEFLTSDNMDVLHRIGYTGDVNQIIARVKREAVELQGKEKELERIRKGNVGESINESDFTAWIVSVSKYIGYRIDRKTTLLLEFLTMNKLMIDELEMMKKRNKSR
jgi:hypothetical protein